MNQQENREYYLSHKPEILTQFDTHVEAWRLFLIASYGESFTDEVLADAIEQYEELIPDIHYIGGAANSMTRHLVRSTTSLVLYKVMKARGKTAEETGKIIYHAVVEVVKQLPPNSAEELSREFIAEKKRAAQKSQERYYRWDWVWEFVEGNGVEFDYGYDFLECGTHKLYHAHDADEFLPFYCYLDFVTYRTTGWSFARTMTLAEGHDRCNFRWKEEGETQKGWPPPFLK